MVVLALLLLAVFVFCKLFGVANMWQAQPMVSDSDNVDPNILVHIAMELLTASTNNEDLMNLKLHIIFDIIFNTT